MLGKKAPETGRVGLQKENDKITLASRKTKKKTKGLSSEYCGCLKLEC